MQVGIKMESVDDKNIKYLQSEKERDLWLAQRWTGD